LKTQCFQGFYFLWNPPVRGGSNMIF